MAATRDIIIKTYGEKLTLWVGEGWVRDKLQVSATYMKTCARRTYNKSGKYWRYKWIRGVYYYDYDSIPNRRSNYYRDKIGVREELIGVAKVPSCTEEVLLRARQYCEEKVAYQIGDKMRAAQWYTYECDYKHTPEDAQQLAEAWLWARLIKEMLYHKQYISLGIPTQKEFVAMIVAVLKEKQCKGLKISNKDALLKKLRKFPYEQDEAIQWQFLVHRGVGNQNAAIVGTIPIVHPQTGKVSSLDVHETLFSYYYMNMNKMEGLAYKKTLYEKYYLPSMEALGLKAVSYSTFAHHTNRFCNRIRTDRQRYGNDYYRKHMLTYIPQSPLQYSGSLWVADGSGTKLAYKDDTGVHTLYMNRIFDVASGYLVGYSIADTHKGGETEQLIMRALERAMQCSNNYGAMEFLSDNGGVYAKASMQENLKTLFPCVRRIAVGNSQANDAERLIKLMNELGRQYSNWSGQFAAKDKAYKANPEVVAENLITKEAAYAQIEALVQEWNNQVGIDGLTRKQRYLQNRHPQLCQKDDKLLRKVFGKGTQVNIAYMRGILRLKKGTHSYLFSIPDYEHTIDKLCKDTGYSGDIKVQVYWDESVADIYNQEGRYIISCERAKLSHKSHVEASEATKQAYADGKARKAKQGYISVFHEEVVADNMEYLDYNIRATTQAVVKEAVNSQAAAMMQQQLLQHTTTTTRKDKSAQQRALEQL